MLADFERIIDDFQRWILLGERSRFDRFAKGVPQCVQSIHSTADTSAQMRTLADIYDVRHPSEVKVVAEPIQYSDGSDNCGNIKPDGVRRRRNLDRLVGGRGLNLWH